MSDTKPGFFKRLLAFIGSTLLGVLKFFLRVALIIIVVMVVITINSRPEPIPQNAALHIAPEGTIVDQYTYTPTLFGMLEPAEREVLLQDIISTIDAAATDKRINSLILELNYFDGAAVSKLEEIGAALQRFKANDKQVVAVSDNYSQSQYLLASFADQIHLNPMGAVEITGFSSFQPYFKDALDKLKVKIHTFKVGRYKSAVEPLTRNDMSDAARQQRSAWLNALWQNYSSRIESQRGLPKGALDDYINTMDSALEARQGNTAQLAFDAGLVDALSTRQQMHDALTEIAGTDSNGSYPQVSMARYLLEVRNQQVVDNLMKQDKIAVVVAKGNILDGYQPSGTIGGDSLAELLQQVRNNGNVDALVLRVDSGGGSAFASEIIRQEVLQIKAQGIPVVVSMGSVAASGGYWIAANADQIWANPTTLTGSIGVFGIFPNVEESLAEIGISSDGVATSELAGFNSPTKPLSDKAARVMQSGVDGIYLKFLQLVADARNSDTDSVHQIAQGRVWIGERAQELGLVDELGSLSDAINAAAQLAGINDYSVQVVEKPLSFEEQLIRELNNGNVSITSWLQLDSLLPESISQAVSDATAALTGELNSLNDPQKIYLRCYDCAVQ